MIPELLSSRHEAPRRRFRGKRRYFRRLHREAAELELDPDYLEHWDYWHFHADWPGWGNLKWRYRLEHLRAHAVMMQNFIKVADRIERPFQCWLAIDGYDAGQDAVYLHSPNLCTPFPNVLPGRIDWEDNRLRGLMESLFPAESLRIGRWRYLDPRIDPPREPSTFFVQVVGFGLPLLDGGEPWDVSLSG